MSPDERIELRRLLKVFARERSEIAVSPMPFPEEQRNTARIESDWALDMLDILSDGCPDSYRWGRVGAKVILDV